MPLIGRAAIGIGDRAIGVGLLLQLVLLARRGIVDGLHGGGMQIDASASGGKICVALHFHARGGIGAQERYLP